MRTLGAVLATAIALPLVGLPAYADPAPDGEFAVSDVGTNNQIAPGPDGNMWVTLQGANDVARIAPDGTVTEYDAATITSPIGITAGPDGNLWVTQNGGVARFSPVTPTTATATAIADIADPRGITVGPDGNLWTASGNKVIKIPPAAPATFTSFAATGVVGARWITSGTDGNLWVADFGGQQIVRVTTSGAGTPFVTGGGPQGVAAGQSGQVAFSDPGTNPQTVGRITTAVATTATPMADPFGVAFGSDGVYWFAQFAANNLGRLTADGQYSTLPLSAGSGPRQISAGPNNTLWVTLDNVNKVARISGVTAAPGGGTTTTPTTTLTKKPKKKRTIDTKRAKTRFRFAGTTGATFQCRLNMRAWKTCKSPKTYRLKPGKYRFAVRAVLGQVKDASPAKYRFRIRR